MPKSSTKRKSLSHDSSSRKRQRYVESFEDDDEIDLDSGIWSQIVAKEAPKSELEVSSQAAGPSHPVGLSHQDALDDEESVESIWAKIVAQENVGQKESTSTPPESDEDLARRLQAQWDHEEKQTQATSEVENSAPTDGASGSMSRLDSPNPLNDIQNHSTLFTQTRDCANCGARVDSPRGYVMYGTAIPPPSMILLLHANCQKCGTQHCRGCFKPLACKQRCKGKVNCEVATCCAEVRAIALFEALGGFDRHYYGVKFSDSDDPQLVSSSESSTAARTTGAGGTGYGTGNSTSSIYRGRHFGVPRVKIDEPQASDLTYDTVLARALQTIIQFLPNPASEAIYDLLPHASISSFVQLSYLPEALSELLRNDSLNEWTRRSAAYHEMTQVLQKLADSELTIEILVSPGWKKSTSHGIEEFVWGTGELSLETESNANKDHEVDIDGVDRPKEYYRPPPLFEHFKRLVSQCQTFLSLVASGGGGASNHADDEVEDSTVNAQAICLDFIQSRDDIFKAVEHWQRRNEKRKTPFSSASPEADVSNIGSNGKGKGIDTQVALERAYTSACERLAFAHARLFDDHNDEMDKGLTYTRHKFSSSITSSANSTRIPKHRFHLIKELSVMATSLPPGIWVRVDEVRNDVLKIMIAGPEKTPYAGGLFEFDCFIPLEYPTIPPMVNIKTTAGGRVRFNPNLYSGGKVCLSLLGTWLGAPEEQWIPFKSTLLQVLISIQSMILIETPYYNEPGHGQAVPTSQQNISYNKNVALQNIRWAMLEWMQPEGDSLWSDVIHSHFSIRKSSIREQIVQWAQDDDRITAYHENTTSTCGSATNSFNPGKQPQQAKNKKGIKSGMNLLAEFDERMEIVLNWESNHDFDA